MQVRFGHRNIPFPSDALAPLQSANDVLDDTDALRDRLQADGFLYLKNFIPRDTVLRARETILQFMEDQEALTPGTPVLEGVMPAGGKTVPMMGRKGITHDPDVLAVLESPELFDIYARLLGEPALTFNYKWLRGVGNEQYTGAHYDIVYMGRGSDRLHTTWVPFGDISLDNGCLAVIPGSHSMPSYQRLRDTYGQADVDRDLLSGWFSQDPMEITEKFGGQWHTTDFAAGDIMIFGMHLMHASTTNTTNRFRLSCDVRYQPAADPVDPRWAGQNPTGHTRFGQGHTLQPIESVRETWGV